MKYSEIQLAWSGNGGANNNIIGHDREKKKRNIDNN